MTSVWSSEGKKSVSVKVYAGDFTDSEAALYTVNLLFPYPVEDAFGGWDPTTEPFPLFAILAPESVANFANAYALFTDQDAYSNGIWQFTDDPAGEPPTFVIDPCDTSEHNYTYVGARIAVASVIQDLYGDLVCAVNANTGDMFYSLVGGASPVVFTAYTSDIDVTVPPTQIDGITPLTDISGGINLPILLTAQTDPTENGFWFATPNRATRTTLRDKPITVPDPVVTFVGDDGDGSTTGSWWVNVAGQGWVAYEGVTDHGALTGLDDDDHAIYEPSDVVVDLAGGTVNVGTEARVVMIGGGVVNLPDAATRAGGRHVTVTVGALTTVNAVGTDVIGAPSFTSLNLTATNGEATTLRLAPLDATAFIGTWIWLPLDRSGPQFDLPTWWDPTTGTVTASDGDVVTMTDGVPAWGSGGGGGQRAESAFTTDDPFTITDESIVITTGAAVVLPDAESNDGQSIRVGSAVQAVTVSPAGTDFLVGPHGTGPYTFPFGNGVEFTAANIAGNWVWAVSLEQGPISNLPRWYDQGISEGSVVAIQSGEPAWVAPDPVYDERAWLTESHADELDTTTAPWLRCYPTAASMDGDYGGTWQITNGSTGTGTLPATPDGIDIRAKIYLYRPYEDSELAAGQDWPYQRYREILTQTKATATGGDLTEWAIVHPDETFTSAGLSEGIAAWFYESTLTGAAGESAGFFYDDGSQLIGVPLIARFTHDTATETVTQWRWVPYDTGATGVEQTDDGYWWEPVASETDARFASMDPNGTETWKIGIQNRMDVAWMTVHEYGGSKILDIQPSHIATAGAGATSFTDGVGNTISTTDGFIAIPQGMAGEKITGGTVAYARLPVGTTASTVAAGDDSRMTDERLPRWLLPGGSFQNSDFTMTQTESSVVANRTTLTATRTLTLPLVVAGGGSTTFPPGRSVFVSSGPGCSATNRVVVVGASGQTINGAASYEITQPNRLVAFFSVNPSFPAPGSTAWVAQTFNVDAAEVTTGTLNINRIPTGTTSSTVTIGNDSRLSDARTPTAHATSHQDGGSDELALDASQTTSGVFNVARLGTGTPDAFTFLDGTGAWTADVPVYLAVKNTTASTIAKGTPVYATGSVGASGRVEVAPADADDASKMPALGLLATELIANGEGHVVVQGILRGVDTSTGGYSINAPVYVSTTAGQLTATKPTGASELIQNIARVIRVHSNGELLVGGALRTNDVPNAIDAGKLTTGTVATARLGTGTATASTYLRGDQTWQTVAGASERPPSLIVAGQYVATSTISTGNGGMTSNRLFYVPIYVTRTTSFDRIGITHAATTAGAGSVVRLGIYNSTDDLPSTLVLDAGTVDLTTAAAYKEVTISPAQSLAPGVYWLAAVAQITSGSPTFATGTPIMPVPSNNNTFNGTKFEAGVSGTLPATATPGASNATQPPVIFLRAVP